MKTQVQHTPTPWLKAELGVVRNEVDNYLVARCIGDTDQEADANAAFIVRAVNSHEAMLEALKLVVRDLKKYGKYEASSVYLELIISQAEGE